MSKITIKKGNIFTSKAQTIVNTVNTVGVMGAGIALEFRLRYPDMYEKYVDLCKKKQINIGKLWLFKAPDRWILNFPTKEDWKADSKIEYLEKGLIKFLDTYIEKGIISIAFPVLGARNGKIEEKVSLEIMKKYLSQCKIPVEIYKYDSRAGDDLYFLIKSKLEGRSILEIHNSTGIQKQNITKLLSAMEDKDIKSLSKLARTRGIGIRTLEKIYYYALNDDTALKLF